MRIGEEKEREEREGEREKRTTRIGEGDRERDGKIQEGKLRQNHFTIAVNGK